MSPTHPSVIPCLSYADAPKAIEWLCAAFGFEKHLVVPGEDGTIVHSQLTRPGGMIMVGSKEGGGAREDAAEGRPPHPIYVVVPDADAAHARAKAAGAEVSEVIDHDYGGRGFAAKDLEGVEWYFGSYDPYEEPAKG